MKASTANIKEIYIERNMTCHTYVHPTPKTPKKYQTFIQEVG
jgi:hypothetical protein